MLKSGGIAGFSEPGRSHSQSPQLQYEMRNFNFLENDVSVTGIFAMARKVGSTDVRVNLVVFLYKGEHVPDSRGHIGLSCSISLDENAFTVTTGEDLDITVRVSHTGSAQWFTDNVE